jgi:hypothetical protein
MLAFGSTYFPVQIDPTMAVIGASMEMDETIDSLGDKLG